MVGASAMGEELSFQKSKRKNNKDYIRWIHGWPCVVCSRWPVQAHHVRTRGAGGGDEQCVPLCADHHVAGGQSIHRLGVVTFGVKWGVDLSEIADGFFLRYQAGDTPPYLHLLSGSSYKSS